MTGDFICRVCESTEALEILFKKENAELLSKLRSVSDVVVEPNDDLPQCICLECRNKLEIAFNFRLQCKSTDEKWRNFLKLNGPHEKMDLATENSSSSDVLEDSTIKQEDMFIPSLSYTQETTDLNELGKEYIELSSVYHHFSENGLNQSEETAEDNHQNRFESSDSGFPKKLVCEQCGKSFSRRQRLRDHMRLHTNPELCTCPECGKMFGDDRKLRRHRKLHTDPNLFKCEECGKVLSDKRCYQRHQKVHTREFNYASCYICRRAFTTSYNFKRHFSRKHKGKPLYDPSN